MSRTRDGFNVGALARMLGKPPPREVAQPLAIAAAGAGGGGGRPLDWKSPDGTLSLYAEAADTDVKIRLQDNCGTQILVRIDAAGNGKIRITGCDGVGFSLTPAGLQKVTLSDPGGEAETETPDPGSSPMSEITVQACVDGVTKTLHLFGWVEA